MAFYAKDKYTADGSTQSFAVTFPFISREHVTVTADGTAATFTWVNNGQITITSPSSLSSEALIIKRNSSPTTLLVDFVDGSNLTESDLDLLATQMFYLAQENIDEGGSVGFADIDEVANAAVSTTAADLLISNGTQFTNVALSGDVTVNSSGVTAIGSSKVVSAMIANDSIVNADVKTDAAIDATKIADGSISNTEFQYLNGASSNIQTQLTGISAGTIANIDDDNFTLLDNADGTKKAQFQCSGITGGATRTLTIPDASGTLLLNTVEDTTPQLGGDLDCNGAQIQWSKGADVASATALPLLTDGNYFDVTGTATVTSFNATGGAGTQIKLHFDAACTLTHNSDLILPGGANIVTAAGDEADFIEFAAGDYRCTSYTKATGGPVLIVNNSIDETKLKDAFVADFTEVTVATGDSILLGDVNDSGNTKRDTVQGIIDLVHGTTVGLQTIWVPSKAMTPTNSNPCADIAVVETTAGRPDMHVLDFDKDADEGAQFEIAFPKSWDEGVVKFQVMWAGLAATTGVAWGLEGVSVPDNSTIDVAYGTAVVVTDDAQGAVEEMLVSPLSGNVTIAGAAVDTTTFFRIYRDVSDGNDDLAGDARLLGVKLFFTTDAENDA